MKTEETEELLKGLLDTGRFVPGDLLQCRSKNDHQIHSGTLTIDGGVEDYRQHQFSDPIAWAKSLGHSPDQAWDAVEIHGRYTLRHEKDAYLAEQEEDEDGLESVPDEEEAITNPFNPEKIKVFNKNLLVGLLVKRMENGEIKTPRFQRKAGIWKDDRKGWLIESLLLRRPIPVFYFAADKSDNWNVVDGLQRTTAIFEFVQEQKYKLSGLQYLKKHEGKVYEDLPRSMQRRIEETELTVNVIDPDTPKEVTFNIFHRINTGGMQLTRQEIRHALHEGPVLGFLKDLAESDEFLAATQRSVNPERLADQELVLRFLAFFERGWESYQARDELDRWLGSTMEQINAMKDRQRGDLRLAFLGAMKTASDIFQKYAFRKRTKLNDRKYPINKALFESWSVALARLQPAQREKLVDCKNDVVRKSIKLMRDKDFVDSVTTATGGYKKVHYRFDKVDQLVKECLNC